MGFLFPLALLFAGLSLPILFFYLLKLRRPRRVVSSTMLWRQALQDLQANAPWQRLRRHVLLLLQLLALALLVLGLARPYGHAEAGPRIERSTTLLLDASASMQATDLSPSRFEVARDVVDRAISRMSGSQSLTLILVGDSPRVLARQTGDRGALRQALAQAEVTSSEGDWQAALDLAAAMARGEPEPHTMILVSDGGLGDVEVDRALDGKVQLVPIGASAENLSIAALALSEGAQGKRALVRLSNAGTEGAALQLEVDVDGALYDARELDVPPGGEHTLTLDNLPADARSIAARIVPLEGEDRLAADDRAWATAQRSGGQTALLVTRGNAFLERALRLLPDLDLVSVPVASSGEPLVSAPDRTEDALHIYDGVVPDTLPQAGSLLFIAPPVSTELFEVSGPITRTQVSRVEQDHPLLDYVDLGQVHVVQAQRVAAPSWAEVMIEAEGGPLLLAGEVAGRRIAVLTFDLHHSDLPLQVAFPILIANLSRWLAPDNVVRPVAEDLVATGVQPGTPVMLYAAVGSSETAPLLIVDPLGNRHPLAGEGAVAFAQTHTPGLYRVEQASADPGSESTLVGQFAVNLFSELESDIRPRDRLPWEEDGEGMSTSTERPPPVTEGGRREWWRWAILAGLAVLVVEWGVDRMLQS